MESTIKSIRETAPESVATHRVLQALANLATLLQRTVDDVKSLDGDFQERLIQAVHDTEETIQRQAADHLDRELAETRHRVREEVTRELTGRFQAEMQKALDALHVEFAAERGRLQEEIAYAVDTAAESEAKRDELQQENLRLQAELQARPQPQPVPAAPSGPSESVLQEMAQTEARIGEISAIIDDPASELSTVMRKNLERSELEAYLRGIRTGIGENGK